MVSRGVILGRVMRILEFMKNETNVLFFPSPQVFPSKENNKQIYQYNSSCSAFNINQSISFMDISVPELTDPDFNIPDSYFTINLGIVNEAWDTVMYENFTSIIDYVNTMTKRKGFVKNFKTKVLGFTVSVESNNELKKSLPYLKAVARDLKKYMIHKNIERFPIGISFIGKISELSKDLMEIYFSCDNNRYPPNFLLDGQKNYSDLNYKNSIPCENVDLGGFNPKFLPYPPRISRCDCIMSMLSCVVDSDYAKSLDGLATLNKICSIIYCGSIFDNPEKGHYGVFSSCTTEQKHSVARNLYYTFHDNEPGYCVFANSGKLFLKTKSVDEYMKLFDYEGQRCGEEIVEDWTKFLKGVPKSVENEITPTLENVYDYNLDKIELSEGSIFVPALFLSNSLFFTIIISLLVINLLF